MTGIAPTGASGDPRADGLLRMETAPLALPGGMRDLLPPRAHRRRHIARTVLAHFESYGYEHVILPAFEREAVISRGLGGTAAGDLVRFLEPTSGELVVLRPDMTPQIARLVATRYRDVRGALRFMYEGSVVRRPRGRARHEQQTAQAGIECIGWADADADVEVIRAAAGAIAASGLTDFRIELGHAGIGRALLAGLPDDLAEHVRAAVDARDAATIRRLLGGRRDTADALVRALDLHGTPEILARAARSIGSVDLAAPIAVLSNVAERLDALGLGARLLVDVSSIRGFGYYTGVTFQILGDGVGSPLASGGRYDELLERFGTRRPATGCGIDLEHLETALDQVGAMRDVHPQPRALLSGPADARRHAAAGLRSRGVAVAEYAPASVSDVVGFARDGAYDHAFVCIESDWHRVDPVSGAVVLTDFALE